MSDARTARTNLYLNKLCSTDTNQTAVLDVHTHTHTCNATQAFNAAQQKTFDGEKKALEEENVALRRKLITAQEFLDNNDKMERSIKELRDELTATRAK